MEKNIYCLMVGDGVVCADTGCMWDINYAIGYTTSEAEAQEWVNQPIEEEWTEYRPSMSRWYKKLEEIHPAN